ncbi:MAG: 2-dehydropantoate 2-reductase N-terminal domain-containing protein, partial [Pseudoclavibacter sp.]
MRCMECIGLIMLPPVRCEDVSAALPSESDHCVRRATDPDDEDDMTTSHPAESGAAIAHPDHVAVIGAGAMGTLFAARIAEQGTRVTLGVSTVPRGAAC